MASCASFAHGATRYWDGATSAGDPGGGAGTWNTATTNWDTALTGGTGVAWTNGSDAVFGTVGGLVTLGAAITASSVNFTTGGYSFNVGTRVLTVNGGILSSVAGNVFSVTGSSGSMVVGGMSNLTAAQSVTLSAGIMTLQYTSANRPFGEAEVVLGGGTLNVRRDGGNTSTLEELSLRNGLRVTGNVTVNADRLSASGGAGKLLMLGEVTIGANTLTTSGGNGFLLGLESVDLTGNAVFSTGADLYVDGVMETGGARTLTKLGTATLVLRNDSTWTGGLVVGDGKVETGRAGAFGNGVIQLGSSTTAATVSLTRRGTISNNISVAGTSGGRTIQTGGGTASFSGSVAIGRATTVNVGSGSAAILSGALSGSSVLTKLGAGTLVLQNAENATAFGSGAAAAIIVSEGRLSVDADEHLGVPGNGVRLNGGGLVVTSSIETERNLSLVTTTNFVDVLEGVEFGLVTAAVSGSGGFAKWGKGVMRLDKAASATGPVTVSEGQLRSNAGSGNLFGTGALRLDYGTLSMFPISGNATVSLSSGAMTIGGGGRLVMDKTDLTDSGSGNLLATFTSASLARVDRGTVVIGAQAGIDLLGAPLGDGERWKVTGFVNSTFFAPYVVAIDSDTLETPHFVRYTTTNGFLSASSSYETEFNPLSSTEVADVDDATLVDNETAMAARISGTLSIDDGKVLSVGSSTTAGLIFHGAGAIRGGSISFGTREALIYTATATVIESDLVTTSPAGGFTKFGPGGLELLLQAGSTVNGNLGEVSVHDGSLTIDDVAALGVSTDKLRIGIAEFTYRGLDNASLGRPVAIGTSGGAEINSTNAILTLDKVVSGGNSTPGILAVTFSGGEVIRLGNSANTFLGDVLVDGAELLVTGQGSADPTVLGAGQKQIRLTNGGTFTLETGSLLPPVDTKRWFIDLDGRINVRSGEMRFLWPNQLAGGGILRIAGAGAGLVEIGEGQGDLDASVVVESGTLIVSGSISGSVSVQSGGTLSGTASVGSVDLALGGTVSPAGLSAGGFAVAGLAIAPGGIARFDVDSATPGTGYDQLSVTGGVGVAGGALTLDFGYTPSPMVDVFYLILNDGADAVTGRFAMLNGVATNLSQGSVFNLAGSILQISYTAESSIGFEGVGNDIAVRSIPEPGSAALMLLGLGVIPLFRVREKECKLRQSPTQKNLLDSSEKITTLPQKMNTPRQRFYFLTVASLMLAAAATAHAVQPYTSRVGPTRFARASRNSITKYVTSPVKVVTEERLKLERLIEKNLTPEKSWSGLRGGERRTFGDVSAFGSVRAPSLTGKRDAEVRRSENSDRPFLRSAPYSIR